MAYWLDLLPRAARRQREHSQVHRGHSGGLHPRPHRGHARVAVSDRWLDYRSFSYEFDLEQGMASPRLVVERLLRLPPEEIAAKRAQLLRVRERFFWHADPSVEGATQRLIADMCAKPKGRPVGGCAAAYGPSTERGPRRVSR